MPAGIEMVRLFWTIFVVLQGHLVQIVVFCDVIMVPLNDVICTLIISVESIELLPEYLHILFLLVMLMHIPVSARLFIGLHEILLGMECVQVEKVETVPLEAVVSLQWCGVDVIEKFVGMFVKLDFLKQLGQDTIEDLINQKPVVRLTANQGHVMRYSI